MSTVKAAFGGWVPLVNLDNGTAIPFCFVFQLPDKLTPSHIRDGLCQAVVLDHVFDSQALKAYDLVLTYDFRRELVLVVSSSISNFLMDTGHFETCFVPVLGTFFLLGMTVLYLCQF